MRRMKIRAVPNIGGGGNIQRVNQQRKPPDVNPDAQSSTETSKTKTDTHGTTNTLLEQSVAGNSSKTELVDNGETTGKKAAITIELDSSDVKQVGLETVCSKSDSPTFHSYQNTCSSEDCDRDKVCPDVEVLPTFSSEKRKEPLSNIDDEIQEVAATESIQCLGTYKRLHSPLKPSSTELSATSNEVEIALETRNELSAAFDGKTVCSSLDNAENSKSRSSSDGKTVNISLDNAENSQPNIRKSNERSPKHDANPLSPVSVVNCVTDDGSKGTGNISSVSTEVVIDDEKLNGTETEKSVITLESDTVSVASVGMSREKTPPVPLGTLTRRPKIRAKPSFISNIGKKTSSLSKKEVSVPVTPVIKAQTAEVILDDEDNTNGNSLSKSNEATSIEERNEVEIQDSQCLGAKSQEILLDDGNDIQGVGSKDVLTKRNEGTNGIPNGHSDDVLFEKIVVDKGEMLVPPVQIISQEKSLPKVVGPSIRRRKINAMPSIVKFGRKQTLGVESSRTSDDINHGKSDQDKQITQLAVNGTSNSGNSSSNGTFEVEEKMTKEVDEKEISAKQNKEIITEESFNSLSSVHTENKQDLPTSTEDSESFFPLKLSQSDSSENSGSANIKITESIPQVSTAESTPSISLSNNIRRSKIRAKPSLFSKRKTLQVEVQEDLVEVGKESKVAEGAKDQTQARLLAEKISEDKAGKTRNEISTDCSLATSDNVNNQTQTRILAEKLSDEKAGENKIEKNTDHCDAVPDSICKSNEALESTQSVSKSSVIAKKRQFSEGGGHFDTKTKKGTLYNRKKVDTAVNELAISDDSGGDKENSSKCVSVGKTARRERHVKESGKVPTYTKSKSKLLRHDSQDKKPTVKSEKKLNSSDNFDSDSEESLQKKIFRERKEKFRKKLSQSQGNIERGQMTMFDLIFWNPINNPMPGRTEMNKKKDNVSSGGVDDVASDILEEQMVDDLGLECKSVAEESKPNSPGSHRDEVEGCDEDGLSPKSNQLDAENCEGDEDKKKEEDEEESVRDVFAPQVKIGPNGQIILDEQSIKIQTTAAKNRDEILSKAEVVEESNDTAHYGKWNKKRRRSCEWTLKETARFYKALSTVGTDFSLMETLFTWRSRAELKTKFKKEERTNRELVDRALKDSTQFDFTPFDEESDYDPEEDRKASRIAERAEAKRKRLEMKQSQKEEERLRKKMQMRENIKRNKERQAVLRKVRNQMKSKKKAKRTTDTDQLNDAVDDGVSASDSDAEYEPSQKLGLKASGQDPVPDLPRKRRVVKPKLKNSDQDPAEDLPRKRRVLKKKRPKTWFWEW
ncbi:uncharacterized protein LOC135216343 isoform X2 [Macrobrachium nipponense]|uniref:uncharacterized protein LOC135216343 isoform X2 n=1 Tax=Macrobrachium nipponense TaxID=159736 RepID=UPI0030C8CB46